MSGSTGIADVERFLPRVGLIRLRGVVAKYPKFEAEAPVWADGWAQNLSVLLLESKHR
jgi:hypothetical protein